MTIEEKIQDGAACIILFVTIAAVYVVVCQF